MVDDVGRARRRGFAASGYLLLVLVVGTNLASPLYPRYAERFDFSALTITLIVAVYAAAIVPSLLLAGPLADVIGYRRVVIPALVLAAAAALLFAFAAGTDWLVVARAVQGVAVGAATPALTAASADTAAAHRPSLGALLASTTTTAGSGLGPVVAGALATASLRVPFLAEAALLGAGLVVAFRLPAAALARRWRPTVPRVPPAMRAEFAVAGGVSFLAWAVAYIVLALAPSYVSERTHNTNVVVAGATTGLLLICAATVQLILAGWPARRAMTVGLLALVAGLAGFVAAGRAGSLPLLLVTLALTGAGQGLAFMGATRQATGSAPAGQRAEVAAAFWICSYLGGGLPVVGVGLLALRLGLVAAVDAVALALTCACLLMLAAVRR